VRGEKSGDQDGEPMVPPSAGTEVVDSYLDDEDTASPRPSDLGAGTLVAGRYSLLSVIGQGGYAVVYLAHDQSTDTKLALKVLRIDRLTPQAVKRMNREADAAREFQHDRLVRVLDHGRFGDNAFLAMELVSGQTLRDRMREGPLTVDEAVQVAEDVAEGLVALHQRGIVHRDVKPSNILLDEKGRAKLADFGLVTRWADDQSRATRSHAIVGTVEYVSPEQALGEELDGRSDLYALGVVFYEMLSGAPLHGARSSLGMLVAHLTRPAPDVRASRGNVPAWTAAIAARLLQKDRANRYPTATALLADLRAKRAPRTAVFPVTPAGFRVAAGLGALVVVLALAWMIRPNPAAVTRPVLIGAEVRGGLLRGIDEKGAVMWTYNAGSPLVEETYSPRAQNITPALRVADIDGDGANEVLIAASTSYDGIRTLRVLESDGSLRFERKPGRSLTFADGKVHEDFMANSTYMFVDRQGRRRLFLLSVHRPWFATFLEELDPRGRLLSEYVASGAQTSVTRLNYRGRDSLILGGYHNETRGGSLTVLSLDHPEGRAPGLNPEFRCLNCGQADPVKILVVPRTDILRALAGKEATVGIEDVIQIDGGRINFTSTQGDLSDRAGPALHSRVVYIFSPDLTRLVEVRLSPDVAIAHDRLFQLGRLDHRFGQRDEAAMRRALTWDGTRWAPVPKVGR
jgi:tRNA A-37 threonylcarbamoyl transferase component Bud32